MCRICFDRIIPEKYNPARAETQKAAQQRFEARAATIIKARNLSPEDLGNLSADDEIHVVKMALVNKKLWSKGKTIQCRFLDGETLWQNKVKDKAKIWEQFANIKLNFATDGDAEIRISFFADSGSWSAVGTDALVESYFPKFQPTMNFGWLRGETPDEEYERVTVHEFGHALGCIHEHQNPNEDLKWNTDAVYRSFSGPPNYWSQAEIDHNVLKKYSAEGLSSTPFDPASIMLYQFSGELFTDGKGTPSNTRLSETDKQMIARMYPQ